MRQGVTIAVAVILGLGLGARATAAASQPKAHPCASASPVHRAGPVVPLPIIRRPPALEPGMVVLDRGGAKVGVIMETHETRDGAPAVLVDVNGTRFTVRTSRLKVTPDGEEAVISLSRSQIRTRAILNTL